MLRDPKRGIYKRLVIEQDKMRGAVLYGDIRDSGWYLDLINEGRNIQALRDQLLFGAPSAANERAHHMPLLRSRLRSAGARDGRRARDHAAIRSIPRTAARCAPRAARWAIPSA